jgi:hypothetical protein
MVDTGPHPSAEELRGFASGATQGFDIAILEAHLNRCDDCFAEVLMHRQLQELNALGIMPAAHSLRRPWMDETKKTRPGKGGIVGAVGGVLAAFAMGSRSPMPHGALARHFPSSSSDPVRNDTDQDSRGSHSEHSNEDTVHSEPASGFNKAETSYGETSSDNVSLHVQQGYSDTCAVQCQRLILNDFGVPITEDQLVKEAVARHLYTPGQGTHLEDVGKLLESHGLEVHRVHDANVFNLATELAQGHKVIVGLDSGELWHQNSVLDSLADRLGIGAADHAVIVSGIDTSDPHNVQVIVTDPGTGDVAKQYPLQEFLDAWHTSHFSMVSTADPVPQWHPEMVNFDYQAGHISHIGHAPYELAHQLALSADREPDPSVLDKLESLFLSATHGHTSWANLAAGGGSSASGALGHLVSAMVSAAHSGLSGDALTHSLDTLGADSSHALLHDAEAGHSGASQAHHSEETVHHTDDFHTPEADDWHESDDDSGADDHDPLDPYHHD